MDMAATLVVILAAGIAAQLIAARTRIPAIVLLIAAGITLGPLTGVVQVPLSDQELSNIVGLGVAIILFEGGMGLRVSEFRRVGRGVRRLTILGPPIALVLGSVAAHYVGGLEWGVAVLMGAILVVTGPTVILPLLKQANLKRDVASLFKWEGIVNDPIGVLLASLAFQYFALDRHGHGELWIGLGIAIATAAIVGGLVGLGFGFALERGWIPDHLKSPTLLVLVLLVYALADAVQDEAGLLTVTVMGVIIGNMKLSERERMLSFKEGLTVVILSALFIIIPASLDVEELLLVDGRILAFVAVLLFVVRPLTIFLSTAGARVPIRERALLAWIAPRGIVAAATAGVFGPAMVAAGFVDGALLVPTVFLVIVVTVLAHGFTLGPLARRLGLSAGKPNGLLLVGASRWSLALAQALKERGVEVRVADGSYERLQRARMEDVPTYYGEVLSEYADEELDRTGLSTLLCCSDNDSYNALVARSIGSEFGYHRTFQLPPPNAARERTQVGVDRRGTYAFNGKAELSRLEALVDQGWEFRVSRLTEDFDRRAFESRLGVDGEDWMLIGKLDTAGELRLHAPARRVRPGPGDQVIYFGPARANSPRQAGS